VIRCDALVVGGGPAGSTCARVLARAGWDVAIVDTARFPRDKVCAGWLTPDVFGLLELDPEEYRATGLTLQAITAFRTGVVGARLVDTQYPRVVSYAIRRYEFDAFLLRRAGVRVLEGTPLKTLRRDRDTWVANDAIEARIVVGAGGHFCPVARHLRGGADVRGPVVAKEAEFKMDARTARAVPDAPELFFCRDLNGYGWSVRKGDYLNVGIGRRTSDGFGTHVKDFMAFLEERGTLAHADSLRWRGHAYLAYGAGSRPITGAGLLLVGDAAGLAYPESGEGIKPAIASGRLAAETLVTMQGRGTGEALQAYDRALRQRYPPTAEHAVPTQRARATIGRWLLGSRAFTRHVVLDRWFLRAPVSR
jgi:geranylgeranyl reductase family protein